MLTRRPNGAGALHMPVTAWRGMKVNIQPQERDLPGARALRSG